MKILEPTIEKELPCHAKELPKLNRIAGQIEGVKRMIGEQRYCPEIIMQIQAVRKALQSVEANILRHHLHSCVKTAFHSQDDAQIEEKIEEIVRIVKKQP